MPTFTLPSDKEIAETVRLHLEADRFCENLDDEQPLLEFSSSDTERVGEIVRKELKSKAFDERVLKLTKNILTQLFKNLYTRRSAWRDPLSTLSEASDRDDIGKLPIPKEAKAYARRTSKTPGSKVKQALRVTNKLMNPGVKSMRFISRTVGQTTDGRPLK